MYFETKPSPAHPEISTRANTSLYSARGRQRTHTSRSSEAARAKIAMRDFILFLALAALPALVTGVAVAVGLVNLLAR